jgi:hypothetical protein
MKPAPVLNRPVEQSVATAKLHFDELKRRYGPQVRSPAHTAHNLSLMQINYFTDDHQPCGADRQGECGYFGIQSSDQGARGQGRQIYRV